MVRAAIGYFPKFDWRTANYQILVFAFLIGRALFRTKQLINILGLDLTVDARWT